MTEAGGIEKFDVSMGLLIKLNTLRGRPRALKLTQIVTLGENH